MSKKELIFSVSIHDCEVQTFSAGGPGGQNQNRRSTGVRVIHHPSGARGESREERSQAQNKRTAFTRMVHTPMFQAWLAAVTQGLKTPAQIEAEVAAELSDPTITITEVRVNKNEWKQVSPKELS